MDRPALEQGVEDGIRWVTLRAPMYDAVNGYALLPEGHPWRQGDLIDDADVHGGITYGPEPDGWVGFDYLHSMDWWPAQAELPYGHRYSDSVERTPAEVAEEARSLARQIAAAWRAEVDAR